MRLITVAAALVAVAGFVGVTAAAAVYVPQIAIYVPVIAIGLALALQKYTASLVAHFVIVFTRIYDLGDRIRIGGIKGDVRHVGLIHTILEEVGEDEKLGGELTGRLLHVPNLIVLDQPVLNYSKDYSVHNKTIASDYLFDEVRIPITPSSNVPQACALLEGTLRKQDEVYMKEAQQIFQDGYPKFLNEATSGPRVLVYVEKQCIWIQGKFVAPVRGRNDLRTRILLEFLHEVNARPDIKLA
ncbi:MAG: mechanosensitive ion channel [Chloroflexota bacterium]|nr:mechanosensitive ion channel [Chloroflexota bacterium]